MDYKKEEIKEYFDDFISDYFENNQRFLLTKFKGEA